MSVCGFARVHVYDPTGVTKLAAVGVRSLSFSDQLGGKGSCTFEVPATDPAMVATPTLLDDCVVKVAVPLTEGAVPTEVAAYANRVPVAAILADDAGDLVYRVTAASLLEVWGRDAVILPEYAAAGNMPRAAGRERGIGWMSSAYDPAGDPSIWNKIYEPTRAARPTEPAWPVGTSAVWVSCTAGGGDRKLFVADLTIAADNTAVRFYWSSDEGATLWVGGEAVGSTDDVETGRKYTRTVDMVLAAGDYRVGIDTSTHVSIGGDGVDPVILACCSIDDDGDPVSWLLETNDVDWVATRLEIEDGTPPGPTPGAILLALVDEAQGIDVATWDALTVDFDAADDSDAVAWTTHPEMVLTYAADTYADVIDRLGDAGLDCRIGPDLVLQARAFQGADKTAASPPVALRGIRSITSQAEPMVGTAVHVLTLDGWTTVTDSTQYAAVGRRATYLELGTAPSIQQGRRLTANAMPDLAYPLQTWTVTFAAEPGCVPFDDWTVGDTIYTGRPGVLEAKRTLALSGSWDGAGPVLWTVEMEA